MASANVAIPSPASQREELASVRPQMAKAAISTHLPAIELRALAGEAIRRVHGKALTAAELVGVHHAHLGRLINDGDLKLKQLESLGPETLAELGKQLVEHFGALATPHARARRIVRELHHAIDELEQLVEHIT